MRRTFLWINVVLASIIVLGVFLQAWFIATYIIGNEESALDAHGVLGGLVIHGAELLVFLTAFGAWPRAWRPACARSCPVRLPPRRSPAG